MPFNLYRYQRSTTPGPDGAPQSVQGESITEIALLDGWTYIAVDGDLDSDASHLTLELVEQAPELVAELVRASPRHQLLLDTVAAMRYCVEVGGISFSGLPVATDRDSRSSLIGAHQSVVLGLRAEGATWKFADGISRSVPNSQMVAIALAVLAHVQACFDREAQIAASIRSSLIPDETAIYTGWPAASA